MSTPSSSQRRRHGDTAAAITTSKPNSSRTVRNQHSSNKKDNTNDSRMRKLSKTLSWALRHKAVELGWNMTSDGFVRVDEVLRHARFRGYDLSDLRQVVESNDKQRYKLQERPAANYGIIPQDDDGRSEHCDTAVLCIRANQGHSIPHIDPDLLLQRLTPSQLAATPMIVHGTYKGAWKNIQKQGLNRMGRNHIHFATGFPKDNGVISGMRKTCDVFIFIDPIKCSEDEIVFFKSDNGVLLTAGSGDEGCLPVRYFLRVTDSLGSDLIKPEEAR